MTNILAGFCLLTILLVMYSALVVGSDYDDEREDN